jgi:hypothetical protein
MYKRIVCRKNLLFLSQMTPSLWSKEVCTENPKKSIQIKTIQNQKQKSKRSIKTQMETVQTKMKIKS